MNYTFFNTPMDQMGGNIYPTLIEIYGIILLGYISGRWSWFTISEGTGISLFITYIALPVVVFKAMVTVKFNEINWIFWSGLFLAKAVVFFVTLLVTLLFTRTNKLGTAGLYSIFVTQSNDFAFGVPLFSSIFTTPQQRRLIDYLYLLVPVSLAILNPIGFALLEYDKAKKDSAMSLTDNGKKKKVKLRTIVFRTFKGIITNPFVFMIVFGIAANFLLNHQIPILLQNFFNSLSAAFGPTALFYLGWKLANSSAKIRGSNLLVPVVLIVVKGIALPFLMRQIVSTLTLEKSTSSGNSNSTLEVDSEATFAFLYGAIPTAPTVLIYAGRYGIAESIVSSGVVMGTILAAPSIFASMRMLQVNKMMEIHKFYLLIKGVSVDIGILVGVCLVWVIFIVFIPLRLYKRRVHFYTFILILHQLLLSVLPIVYDKVPLKSIKVAVWVLIYTTLSCQLWVGILAIALAYYSRSKNRMKKRWRCIACFVGFGLPIILATVGVLTSPNIMDGVEVDRTVFFMVPCFKKNTTLSLITLVSNIITVIIVIVSLIKIKSSPSDINNLPEKAVHRKKKVKSEDENTEDSQHSCSGLSSSSTNIDFDNLQPVRYTLENQCSDVRSGLVDKDATFLKGVEDMESKQISTYALSNRYHVTNHVIVILISGFNLLINITVIVWNILNLDRRVKGIYLELEMLDLVLFYGQGFFTFVLFGFLKELFMLPIFESFKTKLMSCFKARFCNPPQISLTEVDELDPQVIEQCEKFRLHHLENCSNSITANLRFNFQRYKCAFKGTSLVDWLIENGLANDRQDAVKYGNSLLQGRVIQHCQNKYHFYDLPFIYQLNYVPITPSVSFYSGEEENLPLID